MEDMSQQLEQIKKTARTKSTEENMTHAINQLSLDMKELKDECKMNQAIYDDLVEKVQVMLEQRI